MDKTNTLTNWFRDDLKAFLDLKDVICYVDSSNLNHYELTTHDDSTIKFSITDQQILDQDLDLEDLVVENYMLYYITLKPKS